MISSTELTKAAESLIIISQRLPSNSEPTRAGGFLTIGVNGFEEKYTLGIGHYDPTKKGKYSRLSQEKAFRLYADWLRDPTLTISSWQTRDPEISRWGGAVLFYEEGLIPRQTLPTIISFSGLTEHVDEALSLTLGYRFGIVVDATLAEKVAKISGNKVIKEMLNIYSGHKPSI